MSALKKSILIISVILVFDQIVKLWIKTHMFIGQSYNVLGNWFIIRFTENNGMAFGMEMGGDSGKILLSIFRILAVIGIGWYMVHLQKKNAHQGLIITLGLILAGALGNIIDSAFYGLIFSDSYASPDGIAQIFPDGGGYSSFLHGKVVDMLYFPLFTVDLPAWAHDRFGTEFTFFSPIFNIADSSITIGVFLILFFQGKFFKKEIFLEKNPETETKIENTEKTIEVKEN